MEYKQIIQSSKPYKYGRDNQFTTREEALKAINRLKQSVETRISLVRLYELTKTEIIEGENEIQLIVKISIPQFV